MLDLRKLTLDLHNVMKEEGERRVRRGSEASVISKDTTLHTVASGMASSHLSLAYHHYDIWHVITTTMFGRGGHGDNARACICISPLYGWTFILSQMSMHYRAYSTSYVFTLRWSLGIRHCLTMQDFSLLNCCAPL